MSVRRVVRIALIGDPIANARVNLQMLARAMRAGSQSQQQADRLASMLERIVAGDDPERVLGLTSAANAPRDPDRTRIMALDYAMRDALRPRPQSIYKRVTKDWGERSVDTVKQIYRRERSTAVYLLRGFLTEELRSRGSGYDQNSSATLLFDAVADARRAILAGTTAPHVTKRADEPIEACLYLGHVAHYYSHAGVGTSAS